MVIHFPRNEAGRDFVIGDLHGCFDLFMEAFKGLEIDTKVDRVFSVGDLIDRGPDSAKCLALAQQPWFHAVRGNHEQMMIEAVRGRMQPMLWLQNGGQWFADLKPGELTDFAAWAEALPLAITVDEGERRFNLLHAEFFGTDADLDAGAVDQTIMQWGRDIVTGNEGSRTQEGLSPTYVGHSTVTSPKRRLQQIFIDTGAGYPGGYLTIVESAHRCPLGCKAQIDFAVVCMAPRVLRGTRGWRKASWPSS